MRRFVHIALVLAIGLFAVAELSADVITQPPLSGNFAFVVSGFELITPAGSSSLRLDIRGEGLVTADGNGNLNGSENFTATSAALPEISGSPVAAPCTGAVTGTVKEPGDGSAQIVLQFVPSTPPPTGVGAQDACVPSTTTLSCVEIYAGSPFLPPILAANEAQRRHHHHHRHGSGNNNGPGNGPPNGFGGSSGNGQPSGGAGGTAPIAWPWFFAAGAQSVKCVATGVSTTSTLASIDGASLALDLRQTPPASITIPTPEPDPSPVPVPLGPPVMQR